VALLAPVVLIFSTFVTWIFIAPPLINLDTTASAHAIALNHSEERQPKTTIQGGAAFRVTQPEER
jgi:hypothetical protein